MTEKDLRRYLRQAEARLVCSPARRREFEAFARQSLEEFAAENPDADYTACLEQFGTPESTAAQFMESLPPEEVESWRKRRQRCRRLGIAAVVLVIAVLAGIVVFFYVTNGVAIITVKETNTTLYYDDSKGVLTAEEIQELLPTPPMPENLH